MLQIEELRSLMLFEKLSATQAAWLLERAILETYPSGAFVFKQNEPSVALWVLVEGEWRLSYMLDGTEITFVTTAVAGTWAGAIPILNLKTYQNSAHVLQPSRFLKIASADVDYMLATGFPIAPHLISGISMGSRTLEGQLRQHEKMAALGKLSAGLAHELNNPAAAGQRAAAQMRETLQIIQTESLNLNRKLEATQLDQLAVLQKEALVRAEIPLKRDLIEQSEAEDAVIAWLEEQRVEDGWKIAPILAEAGLDAVWLANFDAQLRTPFLGDILNWLCANLTATVLIKQLEQSNARISTLVKAVKEYSYMDQAPQQEVDIHEGIENTLTMLGSKLKGNITVQRHYDHTLPRLTIFGSELNQVWTNLLDNAIDALRGRGEIAIRTWQEEKYAVVEIADNGPGIPLEIQSRIFEPFFTTKGVGEGTGLGLDTAYKIVVTHHKGNIKLKSKPGDTRFQVYLPLTLAD
jgi:signal transduction histidine kinase